jgi:single-strand DNA-binding protein
MANFNKVILLGNLTRDIELRHTQSGLALAKFGMAINRRMTGQDGEAKETTCFVDLTAFGKQAEVLNQYVGKGSPLFVEGRLEYSTWDGQDGQKHSKLAVVVENFQFVGAPRGAGGGEGGGGGPRPRPARSAGPAREAQPGENPVDYGDIPF